LAAALAGVSRLTMSRFWTWANTAAQAGVTVSAGTLAALMTSRSSGHARRATCSGMVQPPFADSLALISPAVTTRVSDCTALLAYGCGLRARTAERISAGVRAIMSSGLESHDSRRGLYLIALGRRDYR
jgi:hypothetical protein